MTHEEAAFKRHLEALRKLYGSSTGKTKLRLTALLIEFIKVNYNIELKGFIPNDPQKFREERAKLDAELNEDFKN